MSKFSYSKESFIGKKHLHFLTLIKGNVHLIFQKSETIPAGSIKSREPSIKHTNKKQIKPSNRSSRAKCWLFTETKKVKQLNSEIPKFKT